MHFTGHFPLKISVRYIYKSSFYNLSTSAYEYVPYSVLFYRSCICNAWASVVSYECIEYWRRTSTFVYLWFFIVVVTSLGCHSVGWVYFFALRVKLEQFFLFKVPISQITTIHFASVMICPSDFLEMIAT